MGMFLIKPAKNGFVFTLRAGNGKTIAVSESYSSEAACRKGIASVQKNAPIAPTEDQTLHHKVSVNNPKFELYHDKASKFRFRLKAQNGEIIAASEGYASKQNCLNGILSVKINANNAGITMQQPEETN
jgi:Uncharacterized conserved protein